ncbi:MAG: acetoin utilization protein AcuB [Planctomycetota bacterium]|jgi:acetoin utilization protein AcuB
MIAKYAIEESIPFIKPMDKAYFALDLMEEFKVFHLPVVENDKLVGIVSEEQLLDVDADILIKDLGFPLIKMAVQENLHIFDVMKMGNESKSSVLPVIDKDENYLGLISPKSLLEQLDQFSFAKETGGIFVLEIDTIQYSLAEITRIIESNKSMVLSVATSHIKDNIDKINITIKVNTLDLTYILASFERYNYTINNVFHQAEQIDQLKERYDALMHFINI